ncbi:MAG: YfhO family protein [Blastocatellia bacterium]
MTLKPSPETHSFEEEPAGESRASRAAVWAALLLLPLLYFLPAVLGKITLAPGDGLTQNLGVRILIGQMIANEQLPLWNPYIFSGMPLLASIYPGAIYPPNWLFAILTPTVAMNVVVITTYHLTMIGTYLFARRAGMARLGALVAATAFGLGGYMIAHMGHTSRIAAAAWLPWILLAIEHLHRRLTWRWVALGAAAIALQLFAGEPQMNFYTVLVCGAYGLYSLALREAGERRLRFVFGVGAMSVCGVLLSMIQLLPERELLKLGERSGIPYEYFAGYSFPAGHVFTFLFPFFFGGGMVRPYRVEYWGIETIDETCGYFGLAALLLALVAAAGSKRRSMERFWMCVALVSLALAFGHYLPFELNHLLHRTPVYNLFRASGRHMYEFTFGMAMLAGWGVQALAQADRAAARRAMRIASAVFVSMVAVTAIAYRFLGPALAGAPPRPAGAESLANPEAWGAILFAAISLGAVFCFVRWRGAAASAMLVGVLFIDLLAFGLAYNWGWREFVSDVGARLQDPPAVKFIKSRETDLNSFRIVSYARRPYDIFEKLNFPNVSIARGLQSVNGYDALRLLRHASISGEMGSDGLISDGSVFGDSHQGFNLQNVRYLLRERPGRADRSWKELRDETLEIDGIRFNQEMLYFNLRRGSRVEGIFPPTAADGIAIVSTMGDALQVADETPVARIRLHTVDGRVIEREIRAGRDTAEWAYDRPDSRAIVRHRRAPLAESWPAEGFEAHRYLARIPFDRAEITRVEFENLLEQAGLSLIRASFLDTTAQRSTPLELFNFQTGRWRHLGRFEEIDVFENLRAMPRAWFVRRAVAQTSSEVLATIQSGQMKDGTPFDPAETVLLEKEDFGNREIVLPRMGDPAGAEVRIERYEPNRIELRTRNGQVGFLVLSEVYFRGWDAWIDGERVPVEKVNYLFRGLTVPAGEHRIEFVFRSASFRNGASYTLAGALLLLLGAVGSRVGGGGGGRLSRIESRVEGLAARLGRRLPSVSRRQGLFLAAAAGLLLYGWFLVTHAAYAVGGSDSSGYAALARSLYARTIVHPVTEVERLGVPLESDRGFIPLGFDRGPRPGTMTPFYPIGFPLHMAAGALLAGWQRGPFLVSPICALFCLLLLYRLGRELELSRGFSIAGAVMLGASPTFVFMALSPMSDVAAACWALLAVWAALRTRRRSEWALLAGAAFGVAFLIRPTSIMLLLPILLCLQWNRRTLLQFGIGGAPLAAVFFGYNLLAYGNPLKTGYSSIGLHSEIQATGFTARLGSYAASLTKTMGPLLLPGWLALLLPVRSPARIRAALLVWFGAFLAFYCFYDVYGPWWYTRFLLPAYPALILGALLFAREAADRVRAWTGSMWGPWIRAAALAGALAMGLGFELYSYHRFNLSRIGEVDTANADSCRWADRVLPPDALIASMQMSGAIKYYSQRMIVRWDLMTPEAWESVSRQALGRGIQLYALLAPFEVDDAKKRLPGIWRQIGELRGIELWRIVIEDGAGE